MTVIDFRPHRPSLPDRLAAILTGLKDARRRTAVYRRTRAELEALTARDLADLDIHRAQIEDISREAAARA